MKEASSGRSFARYGDTLMGSMREPARTSSPDSTPLYLENVLLRYCAIRKNVNIFMNFNSISYIMHLGSTHNR